MATAISRRPLRVPGNPDISTERLMKQMYKMYAGLEKNILKNMPPQAEFLMYAANIMRQSAHLYPKLNQIHEKLIEEARFAGNSEALKMIKTLKEKLPNCIILRQDQVTALMNDFDLYIGSTKKLANIDIPMNGHLAGLEVRKFLIKNLPQFAMTTPSNNLKDLWTTGYSVKEISEMPMKTRKRKAIMRIIEGNSKLIYLKGEKVFAPELFVIAPLETFDLEDTLIDHDGGVLLHCTHQDLRKKFSHEGLSLSEIITFLYNNPQFYENNSLHTKSDAEKFLAFKLFDMGSYFSDKDLVDALKDYTINKKLFEELGKKHPETMIKLGKIFQDKLRLWVQFSDLSLEEAENTLWKEFSNVPELGKKAYQGTVLEDITPEQLVFLCYPSHEKIFKGMQWQEKINWMRENSRFVPDGIEPSAWAFQFLSIDEKFAFFINREKCSDFYAARDKGFYLVPRNMHKKARKYGSNVWTHLQNKAWTCADGIDPIIGMLLPHGYFLVLDASVV